MHKKLETRLITIRSKPDNVEIFFVVVDLAFKV